MSQTVQHTTTLIQYDQILNRCREHFIAKHKDYGSVWRILRPSSLTDQLLIKAKRIRNIQQAGQQAVADPVDDDFAGLINYGIMAIIQLEASDDLPQQLEETIGLKLYNTVSSDIRDLMIQKNTDYGEIWRDMRVSSMTDMILAKLLRIKHIENNSGETSVSEGIKSNYQDIVNYSAFALILLSEQSSHK